MSNHLELRLHDGFVTASRLVARLHALGVHVDELHVSGDRMSVSLADPDDVPRVRAVLARCADVTVVSAPSVATAAPTRYVVWCEPLGARQTTAHRSRISA